MRTYLCLCSKCIQSTHFHNGRKHQGLQVTHDTYASHQLNDQKLKVVEALDKALDDSEDSDSSGDSNDEDPWPPDRNSNLVHQPGASLSTRFNLEASSHMNNEMEIDDDITKFDPRKCHPAYPSSF
ncbi:hypothetical protein DFH28DRAFT_939150 [Melampsora americana]|nr:hypothetical protein DFH28DRAFT_939150 [Melampsora americana]